VLILLPPSEGKTAPRRGVPLDADSLSFPRLASRRRRVLDALVDLCEGPTDAARTVLGLGPTQDEDIIANRSLATRPTARSIQVYTGVLFDALDFPSLSAAARRRASSRIAIASALWGLTRVSDRIPAYRISGAVSLPSLGTMAGVWRDAVSAEIADSTGLIVDLRSGVYRGLGPVPRDAHRRSTTVRVLHERDGRRTVVSHMNKATKGRIVRSMLETGAAPGSIDDLRDALSDWGYTVETAGATVDVIVSEL